jgi:hypothetical protein
MCFVNAFVVGQRDESKAVSCLLDEQERLFGRDDILDRVRSTNLKVPAAE